MSGHFVPRRGRADKLHVLELWSEPPRAPDAIARYLEANLRGCRLGPKRAARIVKVLGTECLALLERDPEAVRPLFPAATAGPIADAVRQWARESKRDTKAKELAVKLLAAGVKYGTMRSITSHFRSAEAAEIATLRHPYRLVEVPGIGFATADSIARLLGASPDDPKRYEAACRHVLRAALREGHTGLPLEEVRRRASGKDVLGCAPDHPLLVAAVERLASVFDVVGGLLCDDDSMEQEWGIAEPIGRLVGVRHRIDDEQRAQVESILAASKLLAKQKDAVRMALAHGTSVLTGRPGTGKTTTVDTYLRCARALGWTVQVVAPTGKAASRARQVTGVDASTVHRLLGGMPGDRTPTLAARAVVVDETSMLDTETAAWLLSAVDPTRTSVLWTGDADQLPSVGPGQVLRDLIASGYLQVTELTDIRRQGAVSRIKENAHRLLDGVPLDLPSTGDWHFDRVYAHEPATRGLEHLVRTVRSLVRSGVDPTSELQVLAPTNLGSLGVEDLNVLLQRELNPNGAPGPVIGGGVRVRLGDRVVMTQNAYELEAPLYNGEQALVIGVDAASESVTLYVDDERPALVVRGLPRRRLRLAWAVTVHRSQGSEYPHVVLLYDHRAHDAMLQRAVLYTAITRAQKTFRLIGTSEAIAKTQRASAARRRHTALVHHLHIALGGLAT